MEQDKTLNDLQISEAAGDIINAAMSVVEAQFFNIETIKRLSSLTEEIIQLKSGGATLYIHPIDDKGVVTIALEMKGLNLEWNI